MNFKAYPLMDQRAFQFVTRGHHAKGRQRHRNAITSNKISLCSKQSSLFPFYAVPLSAKENGALVHGSASSIRSSVALIK